MNAATLSRSRALSLWAPISSEQERGHFQRRLAFVSLLLFALAFGFWLVTVLTVAVTHPEYVAGMFVMRTAQIHLATAVGGLLVWMLARRGTLSARMLDVLDLVSALGLCTGWALMIWDQPIRYRPEFIGLLSCTYTLVARAALIPSTPARTALFGVLALAPLVGITHLKYAAYLAATPEVMSPAVSVGMWAVLGAAATTSISWVIYGLRLQVRNAMKLGQYFLDEKIGEGGMGTVYRAHHAMLRRPTAIKLLSATSEQSLERFEREVQITARLTHPNTIVVFDYGRTPDGLFYYAMEYVDGVSLEDLVSEHGPQAPARVVHILTQVCGALEEAHGEGLVHRDIKPANIMLTTRGGVPDVVKVVDFGLVKERVDTTSPAVTNANAILGTPHYLAPESVTDPEAVDGRTDLYALGATAFFLLTAEHVFEGSTLVEVCSKHLHEQPARPSERRAGIPEALDAIVLACLAKKPADRPKDAAALGELLRGAQIPAWTREQARAWWSEHAGAVRERKVASSTSTQMTVPVELDQRS